MQKICGIIFFEIRVIRERKVVFQSSHIGWKTVKKMEWWKAGTTG